MDIQKNYILFPLGLIISAILGISIIPFILRNTIFGVAIFWDVISFMITFIIAIFMFLATFNFLKKTDNNFFIYKLKWLQEILIIAGAWGTILGFSLAIQGILYDTPTEGVDPAAKLGGGIAVSLISLIYSVTFALGFYLIQKFRESDSENDNITLTSSIEGFSLSSLIYTVLGFGCIDYFTYLASAAYDISFSSMLLRKNTFIFLAIIFIIAKFIYKGDSIFKFLKNIFWYYKDDAANILININFIRNLKKLCSILCSIILLFIPVIVLAMMSLPPDVENPYKIFIAFENGLLYFNWIISIIFLLSIYEGREVSKLYITTGKINSGDRYFTLKFVLAPLFLMSLYFFFGMLLTFSVI